MPFILVLCLGFPMTGCSSTSTENEAASAAVSIVDMKGREITLDKPAERVVVSVVHDLSLAKAFGTDALLIHKSRAIAQGKIHEVLTSEQLDPVYGMDVCGWMQAMLAQWQR